VTVFAYAGKDGAGVLPCPKPKRHSAGPPCVRTRLKRRRTKRRGCSLSVCGIHGCASPTIIRSPSPWPLPPPRLSRLRRARTAWRRPRCRQGDKPVQLGGSRHRTARFPDFDLQTIAQCRRAKVGLRPANQACRGTKYMSAAYPAGVHAAGRKPVQHGLYREITAKDRWVRPPIMRSARAQHRPEHCMCPLFPRRNDSAASALFLCRRSA